MLNLGSEAILSGAWTEPVLTHFLRCIVNDKSVITFTIESFREHALNNVESVASIFQWFSARIRNLIYPFTSGGVTFYQASVMNCFILNDLSGSVSNLPEVINRLDFMHVLFRGKKLLHQFLNVQGNVTQTRTFENQWSCCG